MGEHHALTLGRYTLHDEIASGGMAAVYFGRLNGTGGFAKTCAIKRLHPQFARDPDFRAMILDEARLAARIRHPNVVQPLDVIATEGEVLLAMEYVHGEALSRLIRAAQAKNEIVPLPIAAAIMSNVLHGLHAAHEAKDDQGKPLGIVHRDISPHNILVGVEGIARVIDFGIAKAATSGSTTQVGQVKGKVPYLAPEQLGATPATRATDIYAAAVVFWEVLVGRRLCRGESDQAIVAQILRSKHEPPSAHAPHVPPELDAIVLRGLARAPKDRWSTAREMAIALEQVLPLANPSVIGEWVEYLAAEALAARAARIARVESLPSLPEDSEPSSPPLPASRRAPKSPPAPPPRPPPAPLGGAKPSFGAWNPPPEAARATWRPPSRPSGEVSSVRTPEPPPRPSQEPWREPPKPSPDAWREQLRPPPAGALNKPQTDIPNVPWLAPQTASTTLEQVRPRRISGTVFALAFVALGLAIFFYLLPGIVKRGYISSASRHGITLTIDDVDLSLHRVGLIGVTVSAPDLQGVTFRAGSVVLSLKEFEPQEITIKNADVTATGTYPEVRGVLERWRAVHRIDSPEKEGEKAGVMSVVLESGRVTWNGPLGASTKIVAENVAGEVVKKPDHALYDNYSFSAPIVKVQVGSSTAGPWQLDVSRADATTRLHLKLDPTGSVDANAIATLGDDGTRALDVDIPKVAVSELHLPKAALGDFAGLDLEVRSQSRIQLEVPTPPDKQLRRILVGKIAMSATGVLVPGFSPTAARLDIAFQDDVGKPVPLTNGALSIGAFNAKLTGSVDVKDDSMRVELAWKSGSRPCERPGYGATWLTTQVSVDTADLLGAVVRTTPSNLCGAQTR